MSDELPDVWEEMRIDSRLQESIRAQGWKKPTTVQRACIPQILKGRDVSIQSRTGSGKTAAYCVPLVQMLLNEREKAAALMQKRRGRSGGEKGKKPTSLSTAADATGGVSALILVPSIELCEQSAETVVALSRYVKPRFVVHNLCEDKDAKEIAAGADVVVSTPASLAKLLKAGVVKPQALQSLRLVVIDEADLLISLNSASLKVVQSMLPTTHQTVLLSATLTEGIAAIKGQLLRNPTNIILTSDDADEAPQHDATTSSGRTRKSGPKRGRSGEMEDAEEEEEPVVESRIVVKEEHKNLLKQAYLVATAECHKHTLLFALFRLSAIEGKTLIFVDDEQDTYRLQHFLEQLSIATIVYDASLPVNVRLDMLRRFQQGQVKTMICTDGTLERAERENLDLDRKLSRHQQQQRQLSLAVSDAAVTGAGSALHRGIDFNEVRNVILFDGIDSPSAIAFSRYSHRIGRTGRAGKPGTAITFLSVPQAHATLSALRRYVREKRENIKPLTALDRAQAAKLQYRVDTVLGNVTRTATRRLRVATVASELARSSYLSTHLSSKDNAVLKKIVGKSQKRVRSDTNMLEVPDYMRLKNVADDVKSFKKRVNAHTDARRQNAFAAVTKRESTDPLRSAMQNAKKAAKEEALTKFREDRLLKKHPRK